MKPPSRQRMGSRDTNLVVAMVRFCRLLRTWGVRLHAEAAHSAVRAIREIDLTRRDDFRGVLRIVLVQRPEDFALFDYLFNLFWPRTRQGFQPTDLADGMGARPRDEQDLGRTVNEGHDETREQEAEARSAEEETVVQIAVEEGDDEEGAETGTSRASAVGLKRSPGQKPYAGIEGSADYDRVARALTPLLATRPSRRWVRSSAGRYPDLRGMLRRSLRYGGIPVEFPRKTRRVARTRVVLFCDVSRSMDEHAAVFLQFAAAALRRMWKVEVFLFATELVRVTRLWMNESWEAVKTRVPDCGGGTQIGGSLNEFLRIYADTALNTDTIIMILSDGLDAGEPGALEEALEQLSRRSRAIFWLNPLLELEGYEPTARGMATALRYIDVFAPTQSLSGLWAIVERLRCAGGRTKVRAPMARIAVKEREMTVRRGAVGGQLSARG